MGLRHPVLCIRTRIHVNEHVCVCVCVCICKTHVNEKLSYMLQAMGCLRLVGSLKLVSFAEYNLFYRALLRKMTCNSGLPMGLRHSILYQAMGWL